MPGEIKICIDCGKEFELTEGEIEFYTNKVGDDGKPFTLPKRCKQDRLKKRMRSQRQREHYPNDDEDPDHFGGA